MAITNISIVNQSSTVISTKYLKYIVSFFFGRQFHPSSV